jgi:hypothetical protein
MPQTLRKRHGDGYFHALTRSHSILTYLNTTGNVDSKKVSIPKVLAERWAKDDNIETRVAIIQSLIDRSILRLESTEFFRLISEGLDDYTTNARGDIGSHVRLEAIKATKTLWKEQNGNQDLAIRLFPRILRLAAEKLDRVRAEAQSTLAIILRPGYVHSHKILKLMAFHTDTNAGIPRRSGTYPSPRRNTSASY